MPASAKVIFLEPPLILIPVVNQLTGLGTSYLLAISREPSESVATVAFRKPSLEVGCLGWAKSMGLELG